MKLLHDTELNYVFYLYCSLSEKIKKYFKGIFTTNYF